MDWTAIGTLAGVIFTVLSAMGAFIFLLGKHSERISNQGKAIDESHATTSKIFDELRSLSEKTTNYGTMHEQQLKALDARVTKLENA